MGTPCEQGATSMMSMRLTSLAMMVARKIEGRHRWWLCEVSVHLALLVRSDCAARTCVPRVIRIANATCYSDPSPKPVSFRLPIQLLMAKNYRRLWKDITNTIDEAKAVRILAEILVDKEGRAFVSHLDRKDAELCIEILGLVSCNLRLLPPFAVSDDLRRPSQSTTSEAQRNRPSSSH